MCAKKNFIWNPATCSCENGMMTCDEIIEKTEIIPTSAVRTNCTSANFKILLFY